MARLTIISLIVISLLFIDLSYARINPETCVGVWLFNEGKGDVAKDASGNGHDGEIKGNLKWVDGKFVGALSFPGTADSYVSIPHEESLSLTTWSITSWLKVEDSGSWQGIVVKQGGAPRNYAIFVNKGTGFFHAEIRLGDGTQKGIGGKTAVTDSKWHHVAATYDLKFMRVFVDGVLEGESPIVDKPATNTDPVRIGVFNEGESPTKGIVDEVGLFKSSLTGDDILNIMTKGLEYAIGITAVSKKGKLALTWGVLKRREAN
jgi:hypothetical protein